MELKVVRTEDVYTDGRNPRTDFGDIEALAASFDANDERPGEPFEPPLLRQDGGVYFIEDGERRYRAMKLRGTESFLARVCKDGEEAAAIIALATNNKKLLDPVEQSRGVQIALNVGVAPVKIERVTGFKGVARARKAMAKVGDAAEDMTFDRLLAIDEFSDDAKAVAQLSKAPENRWRELYDTLKRRRERAAAEAEFTRVAREHGIEIVEPGGIDFKARTVYPDPDDPFAPARFNDPGKLDEYLGGIDPSWGAPVAVIDMRPGADLYFPKPAAAATREDEPDPELAKRSAALGAASASDSARQRSWAANLIKTGEIARRTSIGPNLRATFLAEGFVDPDRWPELDGCALSPYDYACAWENDAPPALNTYWCDVIVGARVAAYDNSLPLTILDWLDMLDAAGYQADEDTRLVRAELEAWRDRDAGGEQHGER